MRMVCVAVGQDEGRTALHWAADDGHVDAVKALLAAGANVTVRDVCGDVACGGSKHWRCWCVC
jgi:ankyrin repeat protein